jgi:hypothetical protein
MIDILQVYESRDMHNQNSNNNNSCSVASLARHENDNNNTIVVKNNKIGVIRLPERSVRLTVTQLCNQPEMPLTQATQSR